MVTAQRRNRMIIGSCEEGRKVYHWDRCWYNTKIDQKQIVWFQTEAEAQEAGYEPCDKCFNTSKRYLEEKTSLEEIAKKHNVLCYYRKGYVHVITSEGMWKLICRQNGYVEILHLNDTPFIRHLREDGRMKQEYHRQKSHGCDNLERSLHFIIKHDLWRRDKFEEYKLKPRESNNQKRKYNKAKRKSQDHSIKRVCDLIEQLQYERISGEKIVVTEIM